MKYLYIFLIFLTACSDCINSIEVKFSEDVIVDPNALVLTGDEYGVVNIAEVGFSCIDNIATWTFIPPLPSDRYTTTFLADKITDKAGNNLKGDKTIIIYNTDDGFLRLVDDWLLQVGENDVVNLADFSIFARRF